ncbi:MAG: heme ABC exporter ATP-binding protein CcmA [Pseudomonadota bacterium]
MARGLLDLNAVTCGRGSSLILENVTFCVSAGELVVLRGPNGSGKTTLLRTVAGLQNPVVGTITAAEDDVVYSSHADGVKSALTVTENLTFWSKIHGGPAIDVALERLDLTQLRDRIAQELSAGQRRRLGLARLLVSNCRLWIMDEPTVSLDRASVALFSQMLAEHLATGGAALAATHIDFGLDGRNIDVTQFAASKPLHSGFDEALL